MTERVVICEGYHDRAFWAAWLGRLGWESLRGRTHLYDGQVGGRQYAFRRSSAQGFDHLRLVPGDGDVEIFKIASDELSARHSDRVRFVVTVDSDLLASSTVDAVARRRERFDRVVSTVPGAKRDGASWTLDEGGTRVDLVVWFSPVPPSTLGVPDQHCLERLVCGAIAAAHPDRAPPVETFLGATPAGPKGDPKSHAWSYMAKWHPQRSFDDFFRAVWADGEIAEHLDAHLAQIGATSVAQSL